MKSHWLVTVFLCLVTLPVVAGDPGVTGVSDEQQDPHRALREAVENIRVHYAPKASFVRELVNQAGFNRPGLGIIVRGGSPWQGGEAAPGAEILAVSPGSPADEAGLQAGDVIVAWNGELLAASGNSSRRTPTEAASALVARSRALDAGDTVTLRYLRGDQELEVTLVAREIEFTPKTVAELVGRPDVEFRIDPSLAWQSAQPWFLPRGWLDMELVAINPGLGEYFGSDTGVLVVRGPDGDENLGLQSGDVILRIGNREVTSPEHVMRILRSYEPEEALTVDIIRHGRSETLTGTVPETSFRYNYRFWSPEENE